MFPVSLGWAEGGWELRGGLGHLGSWVWALGAWTRIAFCLDVLASLKCRLVVCVSHAPHGRAASGCFLMCALSLVWLSRPSACVVCVVFVGPGCILVRDFRMCPPFKRLLCRLARTAVTARRVLVRGCRPCGVLHLFIYLFTYTLGEF